MSHLKYPHFRYRSHLILSACSAYSDNPSQLYSEAPFLLEKIRPLMFFLASVEVKGFVNTHHLLTRIPISFDNLPSSSDFS